MVAYNCNYNLAFAEKAYKEDVMVQYTIFVEVESIAKEDEMVQDSIIAKLRSRKPGSSKEEISSGHSMKTRNSKARPSKAVNVCSVVDEPSKVLQTGVALGFDFFEREQELESVLPRREEEDELRLNEIRVRVESEGASGGLISLWNEDLFSVEACITSKRCIILVEELRVLKKKVIFCNVYASNVEIERKDLWDYLVNVQNSLPLPWCIGKDFNSVLNVSERKGDGCYMGSILNFNAFVLKARVVDILLEGGSFTWSNNRERASWARLDCFLLSPEFLSWYPSLLQRSFPRSLLDHNVICIGERQEDWGPKPFCFFNGWLEDKALMNEAIEGWKDCFKGGGF
ncbi:hypothetical protein Ddye_005716 [Dipteronia dyeriana]|uniref:Endonuclease/exonuclease/phosphatase domain-containing protein n=1 Tax=Dipteronia dyeriana TaxID=168575 RepID=A0AAD9XHN8_9ROSI|nr:hypothetical protein Ddye_005716 [Dipteronia dyeriana]